MESNWAKKHHKPTVDALITVDNEYELQHSTQLPLADENHIRINYVIDTETQFDIDISFDHDGKAQSISDDIDTNEGCFYVKCHNWPKNSNSDNDIIIKKTHICNIDGVDYFFGIWIHNCNNTGVKIISINLYTKH